MTTRSVPYAIVTARNLVASQWRRDDTHKRHEHRLFDPRTGDHPEDSVLQQEEIDGGSCCARTAATSGADVLDRTRGLGSGHEVPCRRARLDAGSGRCPAEPEPSEAARRVPLGDARTATLAGLPAGSSALSAGDHRRQAALDAGYHLLDCDFCAVLSEPLFDRRPTADWTRSMFRFATTRDIVVARQRGRELAVRGGFSRTEATVIATADLRNRSQHRALRDDAARSRSAACRKATFRV